MYTALVIRQMLDLKVRDALARGLVPLQAGMHTLCYTFARNYLAECPGDIFGLMTLSEHPPPCTTRVYSQPSIERLSTRVE